MKLHIITVGEPKLAYAQAGWQEYLKRLGRYHTITTAHIADKSAYMPEPILRAAADSYTVALVINGQQLSSQALASFLEKRAVQDKKVSFIIGGPEGLPQAVVDSADLQWSLSALTFPHDLAMVILLEALYRASTIIAHQPYHK